MLTASKTLYSFMDMNHIYVDTKFGRY